MKVTKILIITTIIFLTINIISCKSYPKIDVNEVKVEQWDSFQNGQPIKTLLGFEIKYISKSYHKNSKLVYPAVFESLKTIDPKSKPQISRAKEKTVLGQPSVVIASADSKIAKFDDTERGQFISLYKSGTSTQGLLSITKVKNIYVIIIPQEDGTTKVGIHVSKAIKAFNESDLFYEIESKM